MKIRSEARSRPCRESRRNSCCNIPLHDGKTAVAGTSDRACIIRLIGQKQRLLPVRLVPGEVTMLRL